MMRVGPYTVRYYVCCDCNKTVDGTEYLHWGFEKVKDNAILVRRCLTCAEYSSGYPSALWSLLDGPAELYDPHSGELIAKYDTLSSLTNKYTGTNLTDIIKI